MHDVNAEFIELSALIKASEQWADDYKADEENFGKLVKAEAKIERTMLDYLKDLSTRVSSMVNWNLYNTKLQEVRAADNFQVDVMIDDSQVDYEDNIVLKLMYDPIATVVVIGADAGEKIYERTLPTAQMHDMVENTARRNVANLVGKRLDKDGNIIDNPNAKYKISNETRQQIKNSIRTSLSIGEDQSEATTRLSRTIKDPTRAELVAQTEAVNGYQGGMYGYAKKTGATHKQAQYIGPVAKKGKKAKADICGTNADAGQIPINDAYPSGQMHPAFHPRCRCGERFIYPEGV